MSITRTMNDVKPNPLPGIVAAFEARGNGNVYGPVGERVPLYTGPRGQVVAHFNQRSSLVLQHLPNGGPCIDPLTIARRYGPGNWQITIAPEQAHEWFDEARQLLGVEVDKPVLWRQQDSYQLLSGVTEVVTTTFYRDGTQDSSTWIETRRVGMWQE